MIAPIALFAFVALGATILPRLLRGGGWADRSPVPAILVWQALSSSVVLALLLAGAALSLPAFPLSTSLAELLQACGAALRAQYSTPGGIAASMVGVLIVLSVIGRLAFCATNALTKAREQRRAHLAVLAMTATRGLGDNTFLLDHGVAAVYCVPGRSSHIVLTSAALDALEEDELRAALAHERAHLQARHQLVLVWSAVLERAFPGVPLFRVAHVELSRLVEMHADDLAARGSDRRAVASALVRLAEASTPAAALGAGGATALARVRRMVADPHPLGAVRSVLTVLGALALFAAPAAIVAAPAAAAATAEWCPIEFGDG